MKGKRLLILFSVLVLSVFLVGTAFAHGPHEKATGTVTWTARTHLPPSQQIPGIESSFDAHDNAPGAESDRGTFWISHPASSPLGEGSLTVDLECVNVDGNEAWFAGTTVAADGSLSGSVGNVFLYWVMDGGTPGSAGDQIGGTGAYATLASACSVVDSGGWTGTGIVTDGNLKVHTYE